MREFLLYSRVGRTDSNWSNLHDAGRLDIVYECILASLFLSHSIRKDVVFHAILNGPPKPPLHMAVEGSKLYDVRTDMQTWAQILKGVLSGKNHPGISLEKLSFEAFLRLRAELGGSQIYVLEEGGEDVSKVEFGGKPIFVLGDHVGLPRKVEAFALRFGRKISLGKKPYLAATCITILNYILDRRENWKIER